jgi:predicted AlkP superfamily pyrophosphatase or phosphodiesterase
MEISSYNPMFSRLLALALVTVTAAPLLSQTHQPVLLISIDGMRPDYVTQADEHHLHIPTLRHILAEGTHAEGVNGAFPTVTYPNHTTLVTGVWPAEHGILNNTRFDPERKLNGAWYWYADQIKVPTLWDAAHAAGLHTASVGWPVTADASTIDFLIPEYWRSTSPGDAVNPDDRLLMNAVSRPNGELARIAQRSGTPYMMGNDTSLAGDEVKTVYSLDILKQHKPEFMTIHLSSLDEEEHLHGPFSEEADQDLEGLDGMVSRLAAQELENYPNALVVVVSDHGFAPVEHSTNLYIPFIEAGLIQTGKSASGAPQVKSWQAEPWLTGCVTPIVLHDPADTATREKVRTLLDKLAANPANGIEAILDHDSVTALGGFPDAPFVVTLRSGYCNGGALSGPLVTDSTPLKGAHGYNPATTPAMRASFFVMGKGVARGKDLGVVDMRQIAPTLAKALGITLSTAEQQPLAVR